MKLGVFSPVLAEMPFKDMVECLSSLGAGQSVIYYKLSTLV